MKDQKQPSTYISIGDLHISVRDFQRLAPIEARLLRIIGRSINAKLKLHKTMSNWSGDLALHLYHTIRKQADFSPQLDERILQNKVSCMLKNSLRDSSQKNRTSSYAPLSWKTAYYDAEACTDKQEGGRSESSTVYIDRSDFNDVAEMASRVVDVEELHHAIQKLPEQQRKCASLMSMGMRADEICKEMNIKKSRAYELIRQCAKSLRALIDPPRP